MKVYIKSNLHCSEDEHHHGNRMV